MIETKNLSKQIGAQDILRSVSLRLPKGGIVSIIGPNGAGKSTLLSLISRLVEQSSGEVLLDGVAMATIPSDALARKLSIMRQDNHLSARLTVQNLVEFGRYPYTKGRLCADDHRHVARALEFLNLAPLADRFLDELSGGQRQRAFAAMVLCQDTEYVLLDEPLNNLDMPNAQSMMRQLRRMCDELGKTVIMVLHDINFASSYSDSIVAMREGQVAAHGSPQDIMDETLLRKLYDMDIAIHEIDGRRIGIYY